MLHNISLKYCSLQAGPMVQWTIHQDSLNAQTSPQPGLSSMMINDHCRTALHSWHWLQHTGGCRSSPQGRWTSSNSTSWWRSWSTQQHEPNFQEFRLKWWRKELFLHCGDELNGLGKCWMALTYGNVIFDILEHSAFQKYSICLVFRSYSVQPHFQCKLKSSRVQR